MVCSFEEQIFCDAGHMPVERIQECEARTGEADETDQEKNANAG